jgi:predicted LPLAT superfamily acyltransferase
MAMKPSGSDPSRHWARHAERGNYALMRLTAWAMRRVGRKALRPLVYLIVLYFFAFGAASRANVRQYQQRLASWSSRPDLQPSARSIFAQFMAFADSLLDKLDAWRGKIGHDAVALHDPQQLTNQMRSGRGQILIGAHLGNLEVCRALAELGGHCRLNVLVHTRHAERFNRLLNQSGASNFNLVQVSELDASTMLRLNQCVDDGEWLAIAGDRVALHGGRYALVDFLGHPARLPQGPYLLAGLLQCPINLLFCTKRQGRFDIVLERFADSIQWERGNRDALLHAWVQRYADRLAQACLATPLQWFNFYSFWRADDLPHRP